MPDKIKDKSTTSFEAVQNECRLQFGYMPSLFQVRLWYFGKRAGARADRLQRTEWAKQIGTWDMVVRLCLRYTRQTVTNSHRRWGNEEINAFVYAWLWKMPQARTQTAQKDGKKFQGQTFWGWALENRHGIEPIIPPTRKSKMKKMLLEYWDKI